PAEQSFLRTSPTFLVYPLSLHAALPICVPAPPCARSYAQTSQVLHLSRSSVDILGQPGLVPPHHLSHALALVPGEGLAPIGDGVDRKSTRLNSSHVKISYAVFCLKKKNI